MSTRVGIAKIKLKHAMQFELAFEAFALAFEAFDAFAFKALVGKSLQTRPRPFANTTTSRQRGTSDDTLGHQPAGAPKDGG